MTGALNYAKAAVLLLFTTLLFVGVLIDRYSLQDAAPFLTLILGYVVGDGVQAYRGDNAAPLVKRTGLHRRADDGTSDG